MASAMTSKIRVMGLGFFGTGWSCGSIVISWEMANKVLQAATLLVGFVGAVLAVYWMQRLNRAKERVIICDDCRAGNEPMQCPIAISERPLNCPKRKPIEKGKT